MTAAAAAATMKAATAAAASAATAAKPGDAVARPLKRFRAAALLQLLDVTMRIDAARQDQHAVGVDRAGAAKTEAAGAETPDVAKEVETLNERTRLWVYQLADYKSRTLKRSFADLVKVKEKAPPPATAD